MTTNAYLLESKLDALIDAGLKRLTVSLDSIDMFANVVVKAQERFENII